MGGEREWQRERVRERGEWEGEREIVGGAFMFTSMKKFTRLNQAIPADRSLLLSSLRVSLIKQLNRIKIFHSLLQYILETHLCFIVTFQTFETYALKFTIMYNYTAQVCIAVWCSGIAGWSITIDCQSLAASLCANDSGMSRIWRREALSLWCTYKIFKSLP